MMRASLLGLALVSLCASAPHAAAPAARLITVAAGAADVARYPWLTIGTSFRPLAAAMPPPQGFTRRPVAADGYGAWLRGLPLRAEGTPVRSYKGDLIHPADDPRIAAVVELDVGARDWQQCSDSVIRLAAEWRWSIGKTDGLGYLFTSGDHATWANYAAGWRARWDDKIRKIIWTRSGRVDATYAAYRSYLGVVFVYAGTTALAREGREVARDDIAPGDFFIMPGSSGKGHAVQILDVATDAKGHRVALIGQGYMPAQDFQILRNSDTGSPWFSLDGDTVSTPFWLPFEWSMLRRWNAP